VAAAGVAGLSIVVAPIPRLQPAALTVMTTALYAATVLLAVSLILYAVGSRTAARRAGTSVLLPSALAVLTVVTLVAILASSTASTVGLSFAVAVVVLDGLAWLAWGNALAGTRRQHAEAHA
jgi:hypothetical protein